MLHHIEKIDTILLAGFIAGKTKNKIRSNIYNVTGDLGSRIRRATATKVGQYRRTIYQQFCLDNLIGSEIGVSPR